MTYKAVPAKGTIDPEVALLQCANALDAAAVVAERTNDVEGLLNAAAMWLKVGEAIDVYVARVEDAEKVTKANTQFGVGFQRFIEADIVAEDNDE